MVLLFIFFKKEDLNAPFNKVAQSVVWRHLSYRIYASDLCARLSLLLGVRPVISVRAWARTPTLLTLKASGPTHIHRSSILKNKLFEIVSVIQKMCDSSGAVCRPFNHKLKLSRADTSVVNPNPGDVLQPGSTPRLLRLSGPELL